MTQQRRLLAGLLTIACLLPACSVIDRWNPEKRAAAERTQQLQELQLKVMRFADGYVGREIEVLNRFQAETTSPEERLAVQNWKLSQATQAYVVASGPNSVANALDMVVLASLSRMVLDDAWVAEKYGARAVPVQQMQQSLESEAWQLVTVILTQPQQARLREVITQWRAAHPRVYNVPYIHFVDFAGSIGAPQGGEQNRSGNLFSMLGIDPLSNLDPAVREIAQTRELAERAIYYVQRVPTLLDMQVERLTFQFAVQPETKSMLAAVDRISLVGTASDRVARMLPDLLDREREALVGQLSGVLRDQSASLGTLAGQVREALVAGTGTANALHGALDSAGRITAQFATPPGSPPPPPGPPFDIRQYTEMLRAATDTARELTAVAQQADGVLPVLRNATQDATGALNKVVNRLFALLLLLVLAAVAATFLAALAYRRLAPPIERSGGRSQ
jgi:hypothetical protein